MQFMTMREKQILARAILESNKKIGGNHEFFGDLIVKAPKYKTICGIFPQLKLNYL